MLKLILTEGCSFNIHDYGRSHIFKIFSEDDSPFNATAYTAGYAKFFNQFGNEIVEEIPVSWTSQATGVGAFAFTSTKHPTKVDAGYIKLQLEKSGARLSTERRRIVLFANPASDRIP